MFVLTDYLRCIYKTGLRFSRGLRVERPDSIEVRGVRKYDCFFLNIIPFGPISGGVQGGARPPLSTT